MAILLMGFSTCIAVHTDYTTTLRVNTLVNNGSTVSAHSRTLIRWTKTGQKVRSCKGAISNPINHGNQKDDPFLFPWFVAAPSSARIIAVP